MSGPNILNPYWNKSKQERISKNKIHKEGIVGCRFGVDCHYPKKSVILVIVDPSGVKEGQDNPGIDAVAL